jgi:hypothetical protein
VPIVVLSATHDQATVLAALGAGAQGFIPKSECRDPAGGGGMFDGGVYLPSAAPHAGERRRTYRPVMD